MSDFVSGIASDIVAMLDYREALGYSRKSYFANLKNLDRFCAFVYPEADLLTKNIVLDWLEEQNGGIQEKTITARLLAEYMRALGKDAYVLYDGYIKETKSRPAYIFTDNELGLLFHAIDKTKATNKEPFLHEIAPVLYRPIYTCGLRPNEGRELKSGNVNLKTGEILVTNTKWKKERLVVMSDDMLEYVPRLQQTPRNIRAWQRILFSFLGKREPVQQLSIRLLFSGSVETSQPKGKRVRAAKNQGLRPSASLRVSGFNAMVRFGTAAEHKAAVSAGVYGS